MPGNHPSPHHQELQFYLITSRYQFLTQPPLPAFLFSCAPPASVSHTPHLVFRRLCQRAVGFFAPATTRLTTHFFRREWLIHSSPAIDRSLKQSVLPPSPSSLSPPAPPFPRRATHHLLPSQCTKKPDRTQHGTILWNTDGTTLARGESEFRF